MLGKIQPSKRCVTRIRLWPLRRDDHSGVLIGAGGTRRSDWPVRALANDENARIDRLHAQRDLGVIVLLINMFLIF